MRAGQFLCHDTQRSVAARSNWSFLNLLLCLTACAGGRGKPSDSSATADDSGDSSPTIVYDCPALSGMPASRNRLHGDMEYLLSSPRGLTNSNVVVNSYEEDGLPFEVSDVKSGGDEPLGYFSIEYVELQCASDGLVELGRKIDWTFYSVDTGLVDAPTAYVTYDPPMLIIPTDLSVGTTWEINTTRTVRSLHGTSEETVSERREGIEMETMDLYEGEDWPVLRVESSSGRTYWYAEEYGLVRGDGLELIGTAWDGWGGDERRAGPAEARTAIHRPTGDLP